MNLIGLLKNHYATGLLLGLIAPFWLGVIAGEAQPGQIKDALIWTAVFFSCWLIIKHPRFRIRGEWRKPTLGEKRLYLRLLLGVLLIDFGSKALFFDAQRPYQIEVIKNFGLQSVFHPTEFEVFHVIVSIYFCYLFLIGTLYFRFASKTLDRLWLVSSTFALGGALSLFGERLLFGGVHDSFYLAGPLMWLCPPCASPRTGSYAWTPADFFVHATLAPLLILVVSYFMPQPRPTNSVDTADPSASRLQSNTP